MEIPSIVKSIIRNTAPTLLAALSLPPPFNLIAASVAASALNEYLPENAKITEPVPEAGVAKINPPVTPEKIVDVIERNSANPQIVFDLKQAESDLKKYELDTGIKFAEIELEDKKSSRAFQIEGGITAKVFKSGMRLVVVALLSLLVVVVGSLLMMFFGNKIPAESSNIVVAVFGIIGTVVGFVNGIASNVVSFYWGSSQGSKEKSDNIATVMQDLGAELGKAAVNRSARADTNADVGEPTKFTKATDADDEQEENLSAATPAPENLILEGLSELSSNHYFVSGGASWKLTSKGISIEDAAPNGTMGDPSTVKSIWSHYGDLCSQYAKQYGVPVELIVATIAVESRGNPNARRIEAKINDESVGLMQTLVRTARGALGQKDIVGDNLLRPELSIRAGTAYIASQRGTTHFDPPKVAAAYNAGSIRLDRGDANRWKMLCYPTGTGKHIDTFIEFFNDCMANGDRLKLGANDTPSYYALLNKPH